MKGKLIAALIIILILFYPMTLGVYIFLRLFIAMYFTEMVLGVFCCLIALFAWIVLKKKAGNN